MRICTAHPKQREFSCGKQHFESQFFVKKEEKKDTELASFLEYNVVNVIF